MQDRQSAAKFGPGFAPAISRIGHPFVFISLSVGVVIALRVANRAGLTILLILLVCVIVPMAPLLFRGVRFGEWSDADVSVRTERTRFYPKAIPILTFAIVVMLLLRAPNFAVRGAVVTLALLIVAGLVNFRLKLSLHALFAFYSTMILFRASLVAGILGLALALLVFWSRLYLQRHDLKEVLAGATVGLIGGIVAAWWP